MTHASFFTGIGTMDFAFEAYGISTYSTCEIDPWLNTNILSKHFPNAKHYRDITTIKEKITAHIYSGGFPCQDISLAKGSDAQGLNGANSQLLFAYLHLIRVNRPQYAIFENVPAFLNRGMGELLTYLSGIGYMCEWTCISASDFGYPIARKRLFIIARPHGKRLQNTVFRPIEASKVRGIWTPTENDLRLSAFWHDKERNFRPIPPRDGTPDFNRAIKAIGNSIHYAQAQYIAWCITHHAYTYGNSRSQ